MGHIYKSLWLAEALRGKDREDARFFIREDAASADLVRGGGFPLEVFPNELREEEIVARLNQWVEKHRSAFLIIDHWDWADAYWSGLAKIPGTIYVGMDVPDGRFAHFDLAFQGIRNSLSNAEFTEMGCKVYKGPKYLMSSPDFLPYAGSWKYRGHLKKVLLTFGGTDIANFSVKVLDYFENSSRHFDLTLVLGPGCPNREAVKERWARSNLDVEILRGADCLPKYMGQADLVVSAAGAGTLSELALVGAPAIVLAAVPHQMENAEKYSRAGGVLNCAKTAGAVDKTFFGLMDDLAANPEKLSALARKWAGLTDGQGIGRIVAILEEHGRF
ncbi:MAG: hypothetical protein HZA02_07525 [Nitrospinae bacterium]|nr:hypothetical protein [Nitrospinota bacterium]